MLPREVLEVLGVRLRDVASVGKRIHAIRVALLIGALRFDQCRQFCIPTGSGILTISLRRAEPLGFDTGRGSAGV